MPTTWYAVCDRTKARFFTAKPFELQGELENELGRLRNRDMSTDKPGFGKARYSAFSAPHALTGEKDPHEDAAIEFAGEICEFLEGALREKKFDEVVLVAGPRLTGFIREKMAKPLSECCQWVQKDLANVKNQHLPEALGLPRSVLPNYARIPTRAPGT